MPAREGKHTHTLGPSVSLPCCIAVDNIHLLIFVHNTIAIQNVSPIFTEHFFPFLASFRCRSYHVRNKQSPGTRFRNGERWSSKDAPIFFTSLIPVASFTFS